MAWIVRSGGNFASEIARWGPRIRNESTLIADLTTRSRVGEKMGIDLPHDGEPVSVMNPMRNRSISPTSSAGNPRA